MQFRSAQAFLLRLSSLTYARLRMGSKKRTNIRSSQMTSNRIDVFLSPPYESILLACSIRALDVEDADVERHKTTADMCCALSEATREPALFISSNCNLPFDPGHLRRRQNEKSARFSKHLISLDKIWLGREDSNLRMVESKSTALPLGDAPTTEPAGQACPRIPFRPRRSIEGVEPFQQGRSAIRLESDA